MNILILKLLHHDEKNSALNKKKHQTTQDQETSINTRTWSNIKQSNKR